MTMLHLEIWWVIEVVLLKAALAPQKRIKLSQDECQLLSQFYDLSVLKYFFNNFVLYNNCLILSHTWT